VLQLASYGSIRHAFTQITINADHHPLMQCMHRPTDETCALVIVPPDQYAHWLSSPSLEQARSFLTNCLAEPMAASPAPTKPKEAAPVPGGLFN